ncbi:MAG: gluconate 2-dehydrogenase subunit 3 family protein [Gemmatimonadota bacterium]|nr:gluconate 2-dehydrogenase subunit 3 family protein [Gemmatimonadota bacterium]MDH5759602.1 gluconate 2-dehydrogenase subunit 3 family protein [Gemmatimonadota bacterium]
MTHDRRSFLKRSGAAATVAALGGCGPDAAGETEGVARALDADVLGAVAEIVLPSELGAEGRVVAVTAFAEWCAAYEPVFEVNHGYGTSEIRYGPPDPVPGWRAQLQALDVEARKRHDAGFAELDRERREALLRAHLAGAPEGMSDPVRAEHVASALMAHWFRSPEAVDRCYGVRISPVTCRGIESLPRIPEAL